MSHADELFVKICRNILRHGQSDEGFDVRPRWKDGTPAHTQRILYVRNAYPLSNRYSIDVYGQPRRLAYFEDAYEPWIPILTIRKQAFKSAIREILWIYQKKSNDVRELGSHIWDEWVINRDAGNHTIGKAYGYQIGQKFRHHNGPLYPYRQSPDGGQMSELTKERIETEKEYPSASWTSGWICLDQMDAVLYDLKHNPGSRRIMMNMYNHTDLADMGLAPCAYCIQFNVTRCSVTRNLVLNAILHQRSQDMLVANGWNTMQYAVLVHMIAQACGMEPGILVHDIADCHIYDRHIPIVERMIERYEEAVKRNELPPDPTFRMNGEKRDFYQFSEDDFELLDYKWLIFDEEFEVAK